MTELSKLKCEACTGETPKVNSVEALELTEQLDGWKIEDGQLYKEFKFKNFAQARDFFNAIGDVAEEEDHHPDCEVGWGKVRVRIYTHAINGLSKNDFILAAKIDKIEI